MDANTKRTLELLAVLVGYTVVFLAIAGPLLGATVPGFEEPAFGFGEEPVGRAGVAETPRGKLFLGLGTVVVLGYVVLRPRLDGETVADYWRPSQE